MPDKTMKALTKKQAKNNHFFYEQGRFDGVMDMLCKLSLKTRRQIDKELRGKP